MPANHHFAVQYARGGLPLCVRRRVHDYMKSIPDYRDGRWFPFVRQLRDGPNLKLALKIAITALTLHQLVRIMVVDQKSNLIEIKYF